MKKHYKKIFIVKPSSEIPDTNYYTVFRKKHLINQAIAYAQVYPGKSYCLESSVYLTHDELQYLQKKFQQIAGIENATTEINIY